MGLLGKKVKVGGPGVLWHGAFGAFGATWIGFYPWFYVHNYLQARIPRSDNLAMKFARNGFIGFCSSFCSDCVSNSVRVVKTTKQTFERPISYPEAVKHVVAQDGISGLFIRGLGTRVLANGCQSMLFTAMWKGLDEYLRKKRESKES